MVKAEYRHKYTNINVDRKTHYLLSRISRIKRWKLAEFLRFIGEMYASSLDGIKDPDITIEELRKLYSKWELAIYPYGYEERD